VPARCAERGPCADFPVLNSLGGVLDTDKADDFRDAQALHDPHEKVRVLDQRVSGAQACHVSDQHVLTAAARALEDGGASGEMGFAGRVRHFSGSAQSGR
jgi:hypothetical protein